MMENRIKILFFGNDYFGGQFLQTIIENHYEKFEVVGISTILHVEKNDLLKKIKKIKILFKKNLFFTEFSEKIFMENLVNRKVLKNTPPVYPDIKAKALAELYRIPVFDASEVYAGNVTKINDFNADYIIVASFGRIPEEIYINNPTTVINFHPSFLPELRGGNPVYSALVKQMKQTGYSFHHLTQKFDAGPLLFQEKISITEGITCRQLQIEIARAGANKLYHVLSMIKETTTVPIDISNRKITHCVRSYEVNSKLNPLTSTTNSIMQQIKACTTWSIGSSYIRKGYRHFYIIDAEPITPGDLSIKKNIVFLHFRLLMKTADGVIWIKRIYYKDEYFAGEDLLKLEGLLF